MQGFPDRQLEAALVARARAGEQGAFETLYRLFAPRLLSYLRGCGESPADAEDVASGAWERVWRELPRRRSEAPIWVWLRMLARWERFEFHSVRVGKNRFARRPDPECLDDRHEVGEEREPAATVVRRAEIRRLLASLSSGQRRTIIARFVHDLDVSEAAVELGKTPAAIRVSTCQARSRLHQGWKETA